MAVHDQDRAHNVERSVANDNRGYGSERQKLGDTKNISLQDTARKNVQDTQRGLEVVNADENLSRPSKIQRLQPFEFISSPDIRVASVRKCDPPTNSPSPLPHLLPEAMFIAPFASGEAHWRDNLDDDSDASVDLDVESTRRANVEEGDEGKEEAIPASCHTELQSPSPSEPILTSRYRLQMALAKFYSLRDKRREELRKKFAPAYQPDNHDTSSNNSKRKFITPTSTDENKDIRHSPHYIGKPNSPSDSQESLGGEWLNGIHLELLPDGKITVDDTGNRSS
ncbi:hypothetical protein FOXG_21528 [Fusarium oxysporum f. sp. lycopersici 4287]|uniref:Uncharacterized protein n=1 Tax=Fusarium oxysporum f. sp. lycopersici (strain 4287 / CBS 123668 / FGSC 9935 / NRRL 34936) TaxID=426428 RepID=A0A0J9VYM3_FUSO4|nr:hypothetical protein FOXG_21528 [Fusarium oxysporum f. sp. lycopersici 4287]KNB15913.1 hypothetical protein FOXG_21528 [Fusarium oxysporum f. sp. lycopersici 4287]